jgi:hypothetical protein
VGGVLLGVVLFLSFLLTGNGLGASGGVARVVLAVEKEFAPGHVDRSATLAAWAGGARDPLDAWVVYVAAGALLGGALCGWRAGRFRVEACRGPRVRPPARLAFALVGGALMGFGARMARGCTSGQALTGGAVLSLGSWAIMLAIFAGAYALAYPLRRLWI